MKTQRTLPTLSTHAPSATPTAWGVSRALAAVLGAMLGGNGAVMLLAPARWFARVPGVPAPFNAHFVRDIGIAYLVAGVGIAGLAWRERARPAALAGAAFLALHALLHAVEAASHAGGLTEMVRDLPTVHAPAVAALWLALSRHETRPARRSAP